MQELGYTLDAPALVVRFSIKARLAHGNNLTSSLIYYNMEIDIRSVTGKLEINSI